MPDCPCWWIKAAAAEAWVLWDEGSAALRVALEHLCDVMTEVVANREAKKLLARVVAEG